MLRTSALTRKPKGLWRWQLAQGYPRSHATPTPTSRSKGQKSRWGGGILWRPPSRTACSNWLVAVDKKSQNTCFWAQVRGLTVSVVEDGFRRGTCAEHLRKLGVKSTVDELVGVRVNVEQRNSTVLTQLGRADHLSTNERRHSCTLACYIQCYIAL